MQADWKEYIYKGLVVVLTWSMKMLTSIHGTEQTTLHECTKSKEVLVYREDGGL